ncbi:DUF805 domain-containing protein [Blastococcus sp. TF02-8]|uniref:DUF805 domain-containing protein n=1 Tax=Blastococcus sp. TF02-8 TaxID=2250574 RepID=UPI001412AEFB|nr:DUF805 domain-containing protein [Blastococcus sp. TF02-8]
MPTGRLSRRDFWLRYALPIGALQIVATLLDLALGLSSTEASSTADGWQASMTAGPIGIVVALALLVPSIASAVTRLHDRGHSAWWLLFDLLIVIGWIVLFVQYVLPGDEGPNEYGPPTGASTGHPQYA